MAELAAQPALQQVGRPLSLIPVGLKEAALDSPTFRATAVHFSDQIEIIDKWLDGYVKSSSKLVHDVASLEDTINTFLARSVPPSNVSEAVLDHDYTLLAMKRFGEGSRDWWSQVLGVTKKMDMIVLEPIKAFQSGELRNFKDARRYLEQSQKVFDNALARYVGQSKTKEPSSLREDAFQVHEARKAYLKASLDFCLLAPQLRATVDKLLVRVTSDQWREFKRARDMAGSNLGKHSLEMDRIRGWSKEMEAGEGVFRRELQIARREIADTAANASQPSRELEDYSKSTVAFLSSKGPSTFNNVQGKTSGPKMSEKQGWLFLRSITGKPARTIWVRRWFYVKNGIFGWLVQGPQSGGVEESEKIGVLLCNIKPAVQEERRFCFEVKTKNTTILVQAETQGQLMEWLESFEIAKSKALEMTASERSAAPGGVDPAFAITPASAPEFAAKSNDFGGDEYVPSIDRAGTLALPDQGIATRSSFDVTQSGRDLRTVVKREEGESGRDHAARIIQKLDLHRKGTMPQQVENPPAGSTAGGGIASLISASHNILPVYSTAPITQVTSPGLRPPPITPIPFKEGPPSSLAPATLANPPAPTNLSKSAVIVSGERGISVGKSDATGGMPSGIMANLWGTSNWGYMNRLEREKNEPGSISASPVVYPSDTAGKPTGAGNEKAESGLPKPLVDSVDTAIVPMVDTPAVPTRGHRKTMSADTGSSQLQAILGPESFPINYPLELKTQEAQFRMLFPNVPRDEKLVLVFRATWNPNEQQEFPGRAYVTQKDLYFYSHHLGLVLISGVSLRSIQEVTAAPGKDCDFLFLHLVEGSKGSNYTRITIKTFLEPLRLLQNRLNFLVDASEEPLNLQDTMAELIKLENNDGDRSPSMESWEDVSVNTPVDDGTPDGRSSRRDRDLRTAIHVERGLQLGRSNKEVTKFQLPSKPVIYEPAGFQRKTVERQFDISPKALFHVMFGDKSAVFQLLYHERRAQKIARGPWTPIEHGHMRRDFHFQIASVDVFRRAKQSSVVDYQVIDVMNDHVCYVVSDMKTPWHLPHAKDFMLVSKLVITHVAKSKCKLAIFTKVEWSKEPAFSKGIVEKQALDDIALDALDLADVIADQVRKLGFQSRTKKAIQIFGQIGQQNTVSLFSAADSIATKRPQIKQRSLTHMVFETASSFAESVASSLMMWTFAALRAIWKVWSAHSIILIVLAFSVFTNLFYSGRDTSEWWAERNAGKFMKRLGVGPNTVMSKAVYLKDLDEVVTGISNDVLGEASGKCHETFMDITNITDIDAPYEVAGTTFSEVATRATARRLRRTRQHLGTYRHDLLVAMRVVNNVEREMMKAEWENWLLDENTRCKQVQLMLQEHSRELTQKGRTKGKDKDSGQQVLGDDQKEKRWDSLRVWSEDYCGSCKREQDALLERKSHVALD